MVQHLHHIRLILSTGQWARLQPPPQTISYREKLEILAGGKYFIAGLQDDIKCSIVDIWVLNNNGAASGCTGSKGKSNL